MNVEQTLLRKWLVRGIYAIVFIVAFGGVGYLFKEFYSRNVSKPTQAKSELPNSQSFQNTNINISIALAHTEASAPHNENIKIQASGISVQPEHRNFLSRLMAQSPTPVAHEEQLPKLKMLVVSMNNNGSSNKNAISGTDTSIGTGEIDSQLKAQRSPYTIFAGTFIPATLITGLNSDLNGEILARVRNDVYDSTTGKYLIIPQGSRLIGTYNHDMAYGQNRLMVGWNRVIYPNGTSFLLRGQPGTDLKGFSGFSGSVDNHYAQVFGSAFMMGLIFGGITLAVGNQNTNPYQLSPGTTVASMVGAQMAQAGLKVVDKGLGVQPTIIISPGYQFNILTTADLVLKPYIYRGVTQ